MSDTAREIERRLSESDWDVSTWVQEFGHHAYGSVDVADRRRLVEKITALALGRPVTVDPVRVAKAESEAFPRFKDDKP